VTVRSAATTWHSPLGISDPCNLTNLSESEPDPSSRDQGGRESLPRRCGFFFGMGFDYVASMTYVFIQNDMTGLSGRTVQATVCSGTSRAA